MNNYTRLQQILHKIALSSRFMRQAAFDIETSLFSTERANEEHVFIAGLARSGTTVLLNALHYSKQFSSLSYQDMPFVLAPNLWAKLSVNVIDSNSVERAHGDGIMVSSESPEAFEEVFWSTFDNCDVSQAQRFKAYVGLINKKYQKDRYLSKNNQNIRRLELISEIFPRAKILVPYRDPIQHSYSLLRQHQHFLQAARNDSFILDYMKWIGHTEFGPKYIPIINKDLIFEDDMDINHWLEQWFLTYKNCYENLRDRKNIFFVCYEKLCFSESYWLGLLRLLEVIDDYDFKFAASKKTIPYKINHDLSDRASSLYLELNKSQFGDF